MGSSGSAGPLVPSFHGFVHNSMDGLVLFEACLKGTLHHVPRRPHDRERSNLIKSGSIFIYEESTSGIKRWTDGVAWSPSRILGNFLIYRELEKPFPPGEKKRAMKRKRSSMPGEPYPRRESQDGEVDGDADPEPDTLTTPLTPPTPSTGGEAKSDPNGNDQDKELERSLIGSLVDSYGFRPDGLVKKTMSISVGGVAHHMVSYYKVEDVKNNLLPRPLSDPRLSNITVRPDLYLKQNFRAPVEDSEHYAVDGHMHAHPQLLYSGFPSASYGMRPTQYIGSPYPSMYGVTTAASPYGAMTGTAWSTPSTAAAMTYSAPAGYSGSPYGSYYKTSQSQSDGSIVKTEGQQQASQEMTYGSHYSDTYGGQRNGSQSTPNIMQSAYQTPVHQASSTFGSMGARPSYASSTLESPTTNGQSQQHSYGASAQSYAVRSPTHSYGMHSAPNSAVSQSPHPGSNNSNHNNNNGNHVKSPISSGTASQPMSATEPQAHMPYRSASYAVGGTPQSAHQNGDISGLGISTSGNFSNQSQPGQHYGFGASSHAFRTVSDLAAAAAGSSYEH